jgi:hypothetical protein
VVYRSGTWPASNAIGRSLTLDVVPDMAERGVDDGALNDRSGGGNSGRGRHGGVWGERVELSS